MFFLRLRKNERTLCSVEKPIAAEGKRWLGVLIGEAWRLYLLMRHRAVPYQGKPKSVVAIEGSRAQRRILARSGLARYSALSVKEKAAVRLQTTWNKIHQQWVVLWMDNWYNKQFTTNPDKNDKSLNATASAVLLLRDAPRYWHGHPSLEELERRVPVVARMLVNTEGTFARILRVLGFASTRPLVRNIRAPLDIIRPVPAKRRIESLEAAPPTGPIHVVLWEVNSMLPTDCSFFSLREPSRMDVSHICRWRLLVCIWTAQRGSGCEDSGEATHSVSGSAAVAYYMHRRYSEA